MTYLNQYKNDLETFSVAQLKDLFGSTKCASPLIYKMIFVLIVLSGAVTVIVFTQIVFTERWKMCLLLIVNEIFIEYYFKSMK